MSLEQNMRSGFESSVYVLKQLHDDIESQGLTIQGYVDNLTSKLDFIVNANIKKYEFPSYKNDRHYLSHYSKSDILASEQGLNEAQNEFTSKYGTLLYNKNLFDIVKDIRQLVNDIRTSMEEVYNEDIKRRNIEGVKKNKAKVHDLVRLVEYGWIFQAGAELLKIGSTLTVYTVFGAGLSAVGYALVEAEDSKMLFGENKANGVGTGNAIGSFGSGDSGNAAEARMRVAMGLPVTDKKGDS